MEVRKGRDGLATGQSFLPVLDCCRHAKHGSGAGGMTRGRVEKRERMRDREKQERVCHQHHVTPGSQVTSREQGRCGGPNLASDTTTCSKLIGMGDHWIQGLQDSWPWSHPGLFLHTFHTFLRWPLGQAGCVLLKTFPQVTILVDQESFFSAGMDSSQNVSLNELVRNLAWLLGS